MIGKFLLGMVSGGLLVTGGLVVGSMLFPTGPANDNRAVAPVEEPVKAPEATVADAGEPDATPDTADAKTEAPAPEPTPEPAPAKAAEPAPAPEPDPLAEAEPAAAAAPDAEPVAEPATTAAPAETSVAEPAAAPVVPPTVAPPAVTEALPAPAAPEAETATAEDAAPVAGNAAAPEAAPTIAAEPSKPAETTADVAAAAPEPAPEPAPEAEVAKPAPEVAAAEPAPGKTTTSTAPAADLTAVESGAPPDAAPVTEPVAEAPAENTPAQTEVAEALPEPAVEPAAEPAAEPTPAPDPAPEGVAPDAPDAALVPVAPVETMPAAPLPEVKVAEAEPGTAVPEMPGKKPEALPKVTEEIISPDAPLPEASKSSTFKPAPGLPRAGEGVIIKRGTETPPAPADATAPPADTRPIVAFAAPFENPNAKPPFAIVLIDDGRADLDRAGLAALPIPASIALDPLDPATPERAAAYRAAGKEVVMLVTGIAQGAQASDIEVAFQSMAQGLPEAVAAMDLATPAFQNNRGLASAVVPILKAQGRGLLTWDEGLNAADQVARREDLEAAMVFRDISKAGADPVAMRRLLDRAVFKAGQDGRVAVVGTADPATLAALLEWTVEGKAATVALSPLTAVLKVD